LQEEEVPLTDIFSAFFGGFGAAFNRPSLDTTGEVGLESRNADTAANLQEEMEIEDKVAVVTTTEETAPAEVETIAPAEAAEAAAVEEETVIEDLEVATSIEDNKKAQKARKEEILQSELMTGETPGEPVLPFTAEDDEMLEPEELGELSMPQSSPDTRMETKEEEEEDEKLVDFWEAPSPLEPESPQLPEAKPVPEPCTTADEGERAKKEERTPSLESSVDDLTTVAGGESAPASTVPPDLTAPPSLPASHTPQARPRKAKPEITRLQQQQIDEVRETMETNIDKVLARGEMMADLLDQTASLEASALQFKASARRHRRPGGLAVGLGPVASAASSAFNLCSRTLLKCAPVTPDQEFCCDVLPTIGFNTKTMSVTTRVRMGNQGFQSTGTVRSTFRGKPCEPNATHACTIGASFNIANARLANGQKAKIQLWDTAGQERFRSLGMAYYRGAHAIFFVYDITNIRTFEWIERELPRLKSEFRSTVFGLIGNKLDLASSRVVSTERGRSVAERCGVPFFEISLVTMANVANAIN